VSVAPLGWPGAVSRARWFAAPVAIAIASRLFSAVLLARQAGAAGLLPPLVRDGSPFVAWDAQWYLHIALYGYHSAAIQASGSPVGHHDFAFFPGWPLLMRVVSLNGVLHLDPLAVVLANLLFILACVTAYQFFAARFSERTALWATLLLCFNPAAYVFTMAYSEALFMLLAALYFADNYGRLSPVYAGLSTFVRISGLAVGVSAAAMMFSRRMPRARVALIVAAVTAAFAAWWIYIWRLTGLFNGWFEGSPSWQKEEGVAAIGTELNKQPIWELAWIGFVGLMILGSVLLIRRHTDLAIYGLAAIAMSLIGAPASSMPRHAMIAFPAFGALADRLGSRLSAVLVILFAIGEIAFVGLAFGPSRQPP